VGGNVSKKNYVWVVETKMDRGKWLPCAEAKLTRADCLSELRWKWLLNNPNDWFRVRKYEAVDGH
jgi:hypothetical protein